MSWIKSQLGSIAAGTILAVATPIFVLVSGWVFSVANNASNIAYQAEAQSQATEAKIEAMQKQIDFIYQVTQTQAERQGIRISTSTIK